MLVDPIKVESSEIGSSRAPRDQQFASTLKNKLSIVPPFEM
jgi:hypothetical protein